MDARRVGGSIAALLCCAAALAVLACPNPTTQAIGSVQGGLDWTATCPNHAAFSIHLTPDSVVQIDTVRLAGGTTLIPEFHDCQRLLSPDGGYGPLAGIWVSEHLESLVDSLARLGVAPVPADSALGSVDSASLSSQISLARPPVRGVTDTTALVRSPIGVKTAVTTIGMTALPFAVIYAWDGAYPPLHIARGWNCLYLAPLSNGFLARMLAVATDSACFNPVPVATLSGAAALPVTVSVVSQMQGQDYPAVGRWDLDSLSHRQFIGLKCGAAWCLVGPSPAEHRSRAYSLASGTQRQQRVFQVKGWYDEQRLAVPIPSGGLAPASYLGTVVPDPGLDTIRDLAVFDATWVPAGVISLEHASPKYQEEFGARASTMPVHGTTDTLTHAWLCRGRCDFSGGTPVRCAASDGGTWYARYQTGKSIVFKCVQRRDHSDLGIHIPGTARWSWSNTDEKLWFRCVEGCCTSQ